MKENKILRASMLVGMLVCAGIVINYYWQNSAIEALKELQLAIASSSGRWW
jgi:hypothetical protein